MEKLTKRGPGRKPNGMRFWDPINAHWQPYDASEHVNGLYGGAEGANLQASVEAFRAERAEVETVGWAEDMAEEMAATQQAAAETSAGLAPVAVVHGIADAPAAMEAPAVAAAPEEGDAELEKRLRAAEENAETFKAEVAHWKQQAMKAKEEGAAAVAAAREEAAAAAETAAKEEQAAAAIAAAKEEAAVAAKEAAAIAKANVYTAVEAARAEERAEAANLRAKMKRERAARVAADAATAAATAEASAVQRKLKREQAKRVAADEATATAQAEKEKERAEKAAAQEEAKRERARTAAAKAAVMAGQRSMMLTTVGPLRDEVFGWKEAQGGFYKTMTLWSASEPDRPLPPALKFLQEGWVRLWQVCLWCVACHNTREAL